VIIQKEKGAEHVLQPLFLVLAKRWLTFGKDFPQSQAFLSDLGD
jgi:hypothetical protein